MGVHSRNSSTSAALAARSFNDDMGMGWRVSGLAFQRCLASLWSLGVY